MPTVAHPDTHERLRLISLDETELIADLRHINPGRPSDKFDEIFLHLASVVEVSTAADERRPLKFPSFKMDFFR